jgi:hypothetical protein
VLHEFASHDYWRHPKYNQCAVMHLFDLSLPHSVCMRRGQMALRATCSVSQGLRLLCALGTHNKHWPF